MYAGYIQELEFSRRLSVSLVEIESNAYQKNAWYALEGTADCSILCHLVESCWVVVLVFSCSCSTTHRRYISGHAAALT